MEQCQVIDSGGRGVASQAVKIEDFVKQEMPQATEMPHETEMPQEAAVKQFFESSTPILTS